jgi:hypothetical protein
MMWNGQQGWMGWTAWPVIVVSSGTARVPVTPDGLRGGRVAVVDLDGLRQHLHRPALAAAAQ